MYDSAIIGTAGEYCGTVGIRYLEDDPADALLLIQFPDFTIHIPIPQEESAIKRVKPGWTARLVIGQTADGSSCRHSLELRWGPPPCLTPAAEATMRQEIEKALAGYAEEDDY